MSMFEMRSHCSWWPIMRVGPSGYRPINSEFGATWAYTWLAGCRENSARCFDTII